MPDRIKISSWSVKILGYSTPNTFGPFIGTIERINPSVLIKGILNRKYTAYMKINCEDGSQINKEFNFKLKKSSQIFKANRFIFLLDYGQNNSVTQIESSLRKIAAQQADNNDIVTIHSHTDLIGTYYDNKILSLIRANQAKEILENEFKILSRKVSLNTIGYGETQNYYQFDDSLPEGRMYNRSLIIEVVKPK
jgi:outer membrane protein OmpA-like peptidoglycan-associated protein